MFDQEKDQVAKMPQQQQRLLWILLPLEQEEVSIPKM